MFQGTRSTILKLITIIVFVVAVDQTLRKQILKSPGEVVEKYMLKVGLHIHGGLAKSFPERVRQQCGAGERKSEGKQRQTKQSYYYLIKSKTRGQKNLLLCVPPRLASKQALEYLGSLFEEPCRDKRLKSCAVGPQFEPDNNTVVAVMVRHPFDRLIIEYKRQKYQDTEDLNNLKSNVPGRQILFSRHRTGHGRKKNKREFREFITKSLLASNSSVEPITQVCNVCSRHYDVAVKLDESQEVFGELLELVGNNNQGRETGVAKQKTFGEKLQRKYFSEITADEMEKLVRQFESDFLIFGYTFEQYKKALKST